MNGVIGAILPLAVTVAISPLPVMAAILMLFSPRARATSLGFLAGWTIGILVALIVFAAISGLLPEPSSDDGSPQPVVGVIKIVLGALLLLLAVRQFQKRPKAGATPALPKWMSAIDTMTATRALLLGFVLAAANPKNLIMMISAGLDIGTAGLAFGLIVVAMVVFVLLAASTVALPVLGYLVAASRIRPVLEGLRAWLEANNTVVMSVLFLVIGVVNIGRGIAAF